MGWMKQSISCESKILAKNENDIDGLTSGLKDHYQSKSFKQTHAEQLEKTIKVGRETLQRLPIKQGDETDT